MVSGRRPCSEVGVLLGGALFTDGVGFLDDTIRRFFFTRIHVDFILFLLVQMFFFSAWTFFV